MWAPLLLTTAFVALASATTDAADRVVGSLCDCQGLFNCYYQGAFGCVRLQGGGQNCVKLTPFYLFCSQQCGGQFYPYQKYNSRDNQCVCSFYDARLSSEQCGLPPRPFPEPPTPFPPQPLPPDAPTIQGTQCGDFDLQKCKGEGAWGCVAADADYCVDQTQNCDAACSFTGYAYQKRNSGDRRCVCSSFDLSMSVDDID